MLHRMLLLDEQSFCPSGKGICRPAGMSWRQGFEKTDGLWEQILPKKYNFTFSMKERKEAVKIVMRGQLLKLLAFSLLCQWSTLYAF